METSNRIFELADKKYPEQRDFAAEIGVAPSVVSAWRNKKSESYMKRLPQIAEILNLTPSLFRSGPSSAHLRHGILPILQLF